MLVKLMRNENETKIIQSNGNPDFNSIRQILSQYAPEVFGGEYVTVPSVVIYTNHGYKSTYRNDKGCSTNYEKASDKSFLTEGMLSGNVATEDYVQMSEVIIKMPDGTEKTFLYGLDMYEEGFVINTGKMSTNFLGRTSQSYLDKITSTSLIPKTRDAAKHFKDISDVLKYVKKNEEIFRFAVSKYDYQWSWEYASDMFKDFYHEKMGKRKQASFDASIKELEELLDSINGVEPAETVHIYGETQEEEAVLRLKEFRVAQFIIKDFNNGHVQISDVGGIIFDLDDFGKELVEYLKERGHMPYLVLRNGTMYSALYVSKDKENWPYERYDARTELITACCTMANMGFYGMDYGSIRVRKTDAGGLTRVD